MTFGVRISSLKASLRRLEAAAGKGARCAYCRLVIRTSFIGSERQPDRAEQFVEVECEFCHTRCSYSLKGRPEADRDFYRLTYSFTMKDEFTDPRAHAAALWQAYRPWPEEEKGAGATRQRSAERKAKNDPRVRTLNALRDQYQEARERRRKRLVLRYGADPFPEHRRLVEAIRKRARDARGEEPYAPGLPELRAEETRYLVCAELEKILIGRTLLSTEESLGRLRGRMAEMVEGARREREGREEELREGRNRSGTHSQCDVMAQAEAPPAGPPVGEDAGSPWNGEEIKSMLPTVIVRAARHHRTAVARMRAARRRPFLSPSKASDHTHTKGKGSRSASVPRPRGNGSRYLAKPFTPPEGVGGERQAPREFSEEGERERGRCDWRGDGVP
jgi:hypothetical protein